MRWTIALLPLICAAADWPQWRGPNRDGKSAETGLLKSWPEGGPKQVWKIQGLGEGYSSMTVAGGIIYTQGQKGETQYVLAFDEKSGKKLWEYANGGAYRERRGDGPRSMPTVEGDKLWAFSAMGHLVCLNAKTGAKIWDVDVTSKYKAEVPHWGYSESPLIDGDRLIVAPGGSGASVVALNKNTGAEIWKSGGDPAHYSSAIIANVGGQKQILTMLARNAVGLRADNGELVWKYSKVANRTANVATPIFANGKVFYSTAYGTGCALLDPSQGGKEIYFNSEMMNHHATSVLLDGVLYGFSGNAALVAMKFDSGEVAWKDRSVGKGALILADGMFYAFSENGVMGLIEPNPTAYKEVSRFSISKGERPTWSHPVVANGRLYLREQDTLYAFDIKRK